jgi:hypothetical protein
MTNLKRFKSDLWMNWEKFIMTGDPYKEEFTVGTNSKFLLTEPDAEFGFSIPVQGLVAHKGGQIDSAKNLPMQSLVNLAGGLSFEHKIKTTYINAWGLNAMYVSANDISPTKMQPYISGYGLFTEGWINSKYVNLHSGYWDGNYFFAPRGEALFSSVSVKKAGILVPCNQLVYGKIAFKKEVYKDISIELRFECYYEMYQRNFDYSYGLHIVFNRNFFIRKV